MRLQDVFIIKTYMITFIIYIRQEQILTLTDPKVRIQYPLEDGLSTATVKRPVCVRLTYYISVTFPIYVFNLRSELYSHSFVYYSIVHCRYH